MVNAYAQRGLIIEASDLYKDTPKDVPPEPILNSAPNTRNPKACP